MPVQLTPDSMSPSLLKEADVRVSSDAPTLVAYSDGLNLAVDMASNTFGTLIHRSFEVLGCMPSAVTQLPILLGELDEAQRTHVATAVTEFEGWAQDYFKPKSIARELPIMALNAQGTLISGIADMVVETDAGLWVIDHKSDQNVDPLAGFEKYKSQLMAYATVLEAGGDRVCGMAIHWVRRGEVSLLGRELCD